MNFVCYVDLNKSDKTGVAVPNSENTLSLLVPVQVCAAASPADVESLQQHNNMQSI